MLAVEPDQVLAFRLAAHHLHERTDALTAVAACGLPDVPPGWAAVALRARSEQELDPDSVVTIHLMRGAPFVVPRADRDVFTAGLAPPDDGGWKAIVGGRVPRELEAEGFTTLAALEQVGAAARDALAAGPLGRDDFHQALRERLPPALLPWCQGCESHHVRSSLWRTLGTYGVTEMPARATLTLAEPVTPRPDAARELARRFLRCYAPATPAHLAGWAQLAPAHAKHLLEGVKEELAEVRLGGKAHWVLADDLPRLEAPPAGRGVRLLGGHDPYVDQRDRELLFPDQAVRKRVFPALGRPGVVLADGRPAGLWRGRKRGSKLAVEVEWLGPEVDVSAEADAVAHVRGATAALVTVAAYPTGAGGRATSEPRRP